MKSPTYTRPTTRQLLRTVRVIANHAAWAKRMERLMRAPDTVAHFTGAADASTFAAKLLADLIKNHRP